MKLTDRTIANIKLPVGSKRLTLRDDQLPGHYLRVQSNGKRSYACVARDPRGRQVWVTTGDTTLFGIDEARTRARDAIMAIKGGHDASAAQTFETVALTWLKRHVDKNGLRTAKEIRRYVTIHTLPAWGGREFTSIRRGDVAKLLDRIEDTSGPVAADKVLSILSTICNWYAGRHDDYDSPIIRGMRRSKPVERARRRTLDDDEIRTIWQAAEGRFGGIVKLLLLTGQRREKVSGMRWDDLDLHAGTWTVRAEAREKGTAGVLQLPQAAWDVISAQPMVGNSSYVFAGNGAGHYKGYGRAKQDLDARAPHIAPWRLHDLRRTARSLMSRAGVQPHVAERVLGHVQRGVLQIYDRHEYRDEKADALQRLAGLIASILDPKPNVVRLRKA